LGCDCGEVQLVEAAIGDIIIRISHNGFVSKVKAWLGITNGSNGWHTITQFQKIVPLHHLPCIEILTSQLWGLKKYLELETSRFCSAQVFMIISLVSLYLKLKTCFKQGTRYLG
jgi:hypothetical protein